VVIDIHTHIGQLYGLYTIGEGQPITWEEIIARLDTEGIDQAVLLASGVSPEAVTFPSLVYCENMSVRDQFLGAARHADRLIPFGNLDPRWLGNKPTADFRPLLGWFLDHGARGIGEITANIPADDPRTVNLFQQIGELGFPVLIHNVGFQPGTYGLQDDPGMPRLEKLLQSAPDTIIIGHGQGFWAEIAADVTPETKMGYPKGPVTAEGALPRLLRTYPNLYADISANSGYNALTRTPEFGIRFLNEFQDKLLFGTDHTFGRRDLRMPHLPYLKGLLAEGKLSKAAYDKITGLNAHRILRPA
jgi:predicted TIM-barrel fold metal-dependent hydrolase